MSVKAVQRTAVRGLGDVEDGHVRAGLGGVKEASAFGIHGHCDVAVVPLVAGPHEVNLRQESSVSVASEAARATAPDEPEAKSLVLP